MKVLPPSGLILVLLVLVGACRPSGVVLEGVDQKAWKQDRMGCLGLRQGQLDNLEAAWPQLQGLSQNEIMTTLGKPDQHELYLRSQKFFVYYVDPAPACDTTLVNPPLRIHIRFNAMGYANELTRRNY